MARIDPVLTGRVGPFGSDEEERLRLQQEGLPSQEDIDARFQQYLIRQGLVEAPVEADVPVGLPVPEPLTQEEAEDPSLLRDIADIGVDISSRFVGGVGDLAYLAGGLLPESFGGRGMDYIGYQLNRYGDYLRTALSEEQQAQNAEMSAAMANAVQELGPDAEFGDYVDNVISQAGAAGSYILQNPEQAVSLAAQSLGYLLSGGAASKGITTTATAIKTGLQAGRPVNVLGGGRTATEGALESIISASPITKGALGEGLVMAGGASREVAEAGGTRAERAVAVPVGVIGGAISRRMGLSAERAGLADIDTIIGRTVGGGAPTDVLNPLNLAEEEIRRIAGRSTVGRVARGAGRESLEETLQTIPESTLTSLGKGEDPSQALGGEVAAAALTGAPMGAATNIATPEPQRLAQEVVRQLDLAEEAVPVGPTETVVAEDVTPEEGAAPVTPAASVTPTAAAAPTVEVAKPQGVGSSTWETVSAGVNAATTEAEVVEAMQGTNLVKKDGTPTKIGQRVVDTWIQANTPEPSLNVAEAFTGRKRPTDVIPVRQAAETTTPTPRAEVVAPVVKKIRSSKPRYNVGTESYTPEFETDVDKAAYIVANRKRLSKADQEYVQYVQDELGFDNQAQVVEYGNKVKAAIKANIPTAVEGVVSIPSQRVAAAAKPVAPKKKAVVKKKAVAKKAVAKKKAAVKKKAKVAVTGSKKQADDEFTAEMEQALDELYQASSKKADEKLAAVTGATGGAGFTAPRAEPKGKKSRVVGTRQRRGLFMALEGFIPGLQLSRKSQSNAWKANARQANYVKDMERGAEVLDTLAEIHNTLAQRDADQKTAGRTDTRKGEPAKTRETQTKRLAEQSAASQRLADSAARLDELFEKLESIVGRKELNRMQAFVKAFAGVGDRKGLLTENMTTAFGKAGSQTSEGVRFSMAYNAYREGRLDSPFIRGRDFRRTAEEENLNIHRVSKLETIVGQGSTHSQARNALDHIIGTTDAPFAAQVARLIKDVLDKQGLLSKNQIEFVFSDEPTNENGDAAVFEIVSDKDKFGRITFYREGQNDATILHELIHAATIMAIRDPKFRNRVAYKNLLDIANKLANQDIAKITKEFGERPAQIVSRIKKALDDRNQQDAVAEILSYGLTDEATQRMLLKMSATDAKNYTKLVPVASTGLRSMWEMFVGAVKRIFTALSPNIPVSNTQFERFLFSSTKFLNETYEQANQLKKPKVYVELAAVGAAKPKAGEKYSAEAALQDTDTAKVADAASNAREKGAASRLSAQQKRAKEREAREKAAREKRAQAQAATLAERIRTERRRQAGETTAVAKPRMVKKDVTFVDKMWRGAINSAGRMFSNNPDFDYEKFATETLSMSKDKMQEFLRTPQPDPVRESIRSIANFIGTKFGDRFGATDAFQDMAHEITARFLNLQTDAQASFETMASLSPEKKYAVLQYLENKDEAELASILQDPAAEAVVKNMVQKMEEEYAQAITNQLIPTKYADLDLIDFVRLYEDPKGKSVRMSQRFTGTKTDPILRQILGWTKDKDTSARITMAPVEFTQTWTAKGSTPIQYTYGDRFKSVLDKEGNQHFVHADATNKVLKDNGLVPDPVHRDNLFRAQSVQKKDDTTFVTMSRLKTQQEMQNEKSLDTSMASLAVNLENWGRVNANVRFITDMVLENNDLAKEDRWILEEAPEGVAEKNILEPDQTHKSLGLGQSEFRTPGKWVKIPEDAEAQWGALAGKWVAAPAYAAVVDLYDPTPTIDNKGWRLANTLWKKNVTVYSLGAHVNNITGNVVLAYMHDLPATNIHKGLRLVLAQHFSTNTLNKILTKPGMGGPITAQEKALLEEIKQSGIELQSFKQSDLDREQFQALEEAVKNYSSSANGSASMADLMKQFLAMENMWAATKESTKRVAEKTIGKVDEVATNLYSSQDNIFRIAAYVTYMENQQANGNPVSEKMKRDAGRFARRAFVDYNIKAPAIQILRSGKFGYQLPFIAWTYRMVPIIGKIAATKPWKLLNVMGAAYALNFIGYMMAGVGDEDEKERQEGLVPDWLGYSMWGIGPSTAIRLPIGDGTNWGAYYGVGNLIPLSNMFNWSAQNFVPDTLMPGGPLAVMYATFANYDPFRRKELYDPEIASNWDKLGSGFDYFAQQFMPRTLANLVTLGGEYAVDKRMPLGGEQDWGIRTARALGLNVRQIDFNEQAYWADKKIMGVRTKLRAALRKLDKEYLRYGNFYEDDDLQAEYEQKVKDLVEQYEGLERELLEKRGVK